MSLQAPSRSSLTTIITKFSLQKSENGPGFSWTAVSFYPGVILVVVTKPNGWEGGYVVFVAGLGVCRAVNAKCFVIKGLLN